MQGINKRLLKIKLLATELSSLLQQLNSSYAPASRTDLEFI